MSTVDADLEITETPAQAPGAELTEARVARVGDMTVRRLLPLRLRRSVGAWCFVDHYGPMSVDGVTGMRVPPHPHIGLQTVTWLISGNVLHRDSLGSEQVIRPGQLNLMTAGRGIAHSERTPATMRATGGGMFGIQSWIALPQEHEEMAPRFEHFDAATLPEVADGGMRTRVIAGSSFGKTSPVGMVSEWFYAEVMLEAGASAPLDADHEERAIYVTEGEVEIAGDKFEAPQLLIFRPGDRITVKAIRPSRLMFLGGTALEGPRYLWWNFVSSRKERIEQAKDEWKTGRFALIPGDNKEFIPLPDH